MNEIEKDEFPSCISGEFEDSEPVEGPAKMFRELLREVRQAMPTPMLVPLKPFQLENPEYKVLHVARPEMTIELERFLNAGWQIERIEQLLATGLLFILYRVKPEPAAT